MEIPYEKTLADLFRWRVSVSGDDIAHKFIDNETTYSELDKYANKVAQGLISLDCKPDSRVAFLGKNSDQFFEFLYGTIKSNTVTVGINWRLAPPEVAYIINDSQSEVLLVGPEFFGLVEEIKNDIPTVKKIIAVGGHHEEWEEYTNWRDSHDDSDPMLPSNGEDDVIQLYTSGTTGHPKGVQLTNDNFSSCFVMNDDSMYREMNEGEVNLVCMPIFHVAGTNMGLAGMGTGAKNIINPEDSISYFSNNNIINTESVIYSSPINNINNIYINFQEKEIYNKLLIQDNHYINIPIQLTIRNDYNNCIKNSFNQLLSIFNDSMGEGWNSNDKSRYVWEYTYYLEALI